MANKQAKESHMPSTQTGKEAAVSAAVEALRKAMIAGDKAGLDKLSSVRVELRPLERPDREQGRVHRGARIGQVGIFRDRAADQTVNIVDKVALVRHVFNGTNRKDGSNMKLSILTVWLQQQGEWKLLARQAAKL